MSEVGSLFQLGRQRLALIGRHTDLLMKAYLNGYVDETALSEKALQSLIEARILYRPDEYSPLILKSVVSELVASLVQDERKRQLNADVAEHLDQIRTRVHQYRHARAKGDFVAGEHHMQLLTERVHDMHGQFGEAIESLWHRLNTEFGFVSSLDDKIGEIELAQKQLRRLLDGFEAVDFDELIELAGSDGGLRKLLVTRLQSRLSEHSASLLEVQKRLVELMARFRRQQHRAQLISRMASFLRQHPGFEVGDYPYRSQVPELINQAAPLKPAAATALDRPQDEAVLAHIARSIPRPTTGTEPEASTETIEVRAPATIQSAHKQLVADVESFFMAVIDSGRDSALDYLARQQLEWDAEIWLFQVIALYEGMNREDKAAFVLDKAPGQAPDWQSLGVIQDVHLHVPLMGEAQ
ncbi:hypothetical protein HMF8227_00668 [Saliniradius amylolyticus]|uniref:DUF3375 domain-containing protein n=1 Tax=Saliniradius amylolyticus TaxID=2183582 RepID=A0A2S2E0K2_9ALTE|nr:hypothetical protein [Saliniradius amylolyticus]AWL11164.1 hypothetical protein HMF8227_00668 [Saliniradius amylolyticus]